MTNLAKIKRLYLWKPSICKTFWTTLVRSNYKYWPSSRDRCLLYSIQTLSCNQRSEYWNIKDENIEE